jgi:hypothetical protein
VQVDDRGSRLAAAARLLADLLGRERQVGRLLAGGLGADDARGPAGGRRCRSFGVTQVPEARATTTGSASASAALGDRSARGRITLRASKRILRDERPSGLEALPELDGPAKAAFRSQIVASGRGDRVYAVLERMP